MVKWAPEHHKEHLPCHMLNKQETITLVMSIMGKLISEWLTEPFFWWAHSKAFTYGIWKMQWHGYPMGSPSWYRKGSFSFFHCHLDVCSMDFSGNIKKIWKFLIIGTLWGKPLIAVDSPSQRASNVEIISLSLGHDDLLPAVVCGRQCNGTYYPWQNINMVYRAINPTSEVVIATIMAVIIGNYVS